MKVRTKLALYTGLGLLCLLGAFYAGGRLVLTNALEHAARENMLYDAGGRPAVVLAVGQSRSFMGLTELATSWLILSIAVIGSIFIIPAFAVQARTVLNPLSRLVAELRRIVNGNQVGSRLRWQRSDEFGTVANTIDDMLETVERQNQSLAAGQSRMRALLAVAPDLVVVIDRLGRLTDVIAQRGGRLAKFFGGVGIGSSIRQIRGVPATTLDSIIAAIGEALDSDHNIQVMECGIRRESEGMLWVELRIGRVDADRALVLVRDISEGRNAQRERARIEERMTQIQKTESLGTLAGGMAHDFNNILTAMLGNLEVVMREPGLGDASREAVENIRMAMIRASNLTRQMLSYAGQNNFRLEPTDLNSLIGDLVRLMRRSVSPRVELRIRFGDKVPLVEAEATQIWQVVMNLIINSADSMAALSGSITLTTYHATPAAEELETCHAVKPLPAGDYAVVEVADNGHGMDERTIQRIFDPFFTTKAMGRGLGLSACLGIVRAHNGGIGVTSRPGGGAVFRIFLPAARDAGGSILFQTPAVSAAAAAPTPAPPASELPPLRILIADDDPAIRRLVEMILSGQGHQVTAAASGEEAIEILSRAHDAFDLAIIDAVMTGSVSGLETCRILHARRPEMPLVIMSGFRKQEISATPGVGGIRAFLAKPFTGADLAEAVRKAYHDRSAEAASAAGGRAADAKVPELVGEEDCIAATDADTEATGAIFSN